MSLLLALAIRGLPSHGDDTHATAKDYRSIVEGIRRSAPNFFCLIACPLRCLVWFFFFFFFFFSFYFFFFFLFLLFSFSFSFSFVLCPLSFVLCPLSFCPFVLLSVLLSFCPSVLLSFCPVLRSVMAQLCTHYDSGAKLFAYLDDWYLWIKPQYPLQAIAVITAATRSANLGLQSTTTRVWKGSCQDPVPPEFQDKVTLTLSCLGGHLQIHGDTEPSPVVLGEQTTMEKTTQRFQKIATSMAPSRQENDHPTSCSSSSTLPTTTVFSDSATRAREDLSGIDSH